MHIYFSGLGGVGIGPLAQIAKQADLLVSGSDLAESCMTKQLTDNDIDVQIGQDGSQIAAVHAETPIDWLVYTAALPDDHPELEFARQHGIRVSKRDEFLANFIKLNNMQLIAISGTHGKTTTTGLLVWTLKQLGIPVSYSVGTTLSFGPSGKFDPKSVLFVYECDEFDKNMLHFEPSLNLITSLDYDHFDTYPTFEDYRSSFVEFIEQSKLTLLWEKDLRYLRSDPRADLEAYDELMKLTKFKLAGSHNRHNAYLVYVAASKLVNLANSSDKTNKIIKAINSFPGTDRRMEKLADNLYTDYGHHPVEIAATLQMARELSDNVMLVYQPHQNIRQHEIRHQYNDEMFKDADKIYWLPTYLSRENPDLEVLSPEQLTKDLSNVTLAEPNTQLWQEIEQARQNGYLVLCMGAGSIDSWLRSNLS